MDEEALNNALLAFGLGAMGSGSGWDKLSRAGMFGIGSYNQTLTARELAKLQAAKLLEEQQQREMRQMQIEQARMSLEQSKRAVEQDQKVRDLGQRAFAPGVAPMTPNDDEGNPMPSSPAGGGAPEFVQGLMQMDPMKAFAFQQSMAKESPWAKIDPSKYTPESLFKFSKTSNPADLVAAADPIKVGSMRERMQGQNVVQEEWNGKEWTPIGQGPRFKPDGQEKPPAGYRWGPSGNLEAIPGGPANQPSVDFRKQQSGVANTVKALQDYKDALSTFNPADALDLQKRSQLQTLHTNAAMQLKEAYNLGVLNGPDYALITKALTDPMSMRGLAMGRGGLRDQADTLTNAIETIGRETARVNNQPVPGGASPSAPKRIKFSDLAK